MAPPFDLISLSLSLSLSLSVLPRLLVVIISASLFRFSFSFVVSFSFSFSFSVRVGCCHGDHCHAHFPHTKRGLTGFLLSFLFHFLFFSFLFFLNSSSFFFFFFCYRVSFFTAFFSHLSLSLYFRSSVDFRFFSWILLLFLFF